MHNKTWNFHSKLYDESQPYIWFRRQNHTFLPIIFIYSFFITKSKRIIFKKNILQIKVSKISIIIISPLLQLEESCQHHNHLNDEKSKKHQNLNEIYRIINWKNKLKEINLTHQILLGRNHLINVKRKTTKYLTAKYTLGMITQF